MSFPAVTISAGIVIYKGTQVTRCGEGAGSVNLPHGTGWVPTFLSLAESAQCQLGRMLRYQFKGPLGEKGMSWRCWDPAPVTTAGTIPWD